MSFVSVAGNALHYRREGKLDGVPIVFVNSLGCDMGIWDDVIPSLADRFLIIRYDKRGHGLSASPPGPKISDHAEDLAGLLTQLRLNTAIVVGISVGGMIAMSFAAQYPDRVRLLVLADTGLTIGAPETWNERINAIRQNGIESVADAVLGRWFTPDFVRDRPADYQGYRIMLTRIPAGGYTATCAAIRDANLTENARAIQARALVLGGEEDVVTPPATLKEVAGTLPHARMEVIEAAAHLPCIEQPGMMAASIDRFLQENGYA